MYIKHHLKKCINSKTKTVKFLRSHISVVINIILTLINLLFIYHANEIAISSLKTNESNIGFQIDTRSQDYVSKAYDGIYEDSLNEQTILSLKKQEEVTESGKLLKVVDILEEVGSDFCQGTAKARHIRIYLKNTLAPVCNNEQVFNNYKNKKNGLAILCAEFFPSSNFASSLNQTNINTCEFIDSGVFPKTQNRYRFEYK